MMMILNSPIVKPFKIKIMKTSLLFIILPLLTICQIAFSQIPTEGLVCFFPFNGDANDISGNNNNGLVHGATLTFDRFGNPNSAYSFNGISDYIVVESSGTFPQNAISICFWLNREDIVPTGLENYISKEHAFQTYEYPNSKLASGLYTGSPGVWSSYESTSALLNNSDWIFYSFTFDNQTHVGNIYINGLLDSTFTEPNQNAIVRESSYPLYIGRNGSSSTYFINGVIDDIRIFNRALTPSEIFYLNNEETNCLSAYYPFNGNANDVSGNNNNGVVHGATLTTDRFGNPNSAYSFDGISDYIFVENSTTFPQNAISICFWLNREDKFPVGLENYISKEHAFQTYEYPNSKLASGLYTGTAGVWSSYESTLTIENNSDWIFYSFTFDNQTHIGNIYINGLLDSTFIEQSPDAIVRTSSSPLYIGRNGSSEVYYINGKLDDIRIYGCALNEEDIFSLYEDLSTEVALIPQKSFLKVFPNPANEKIIISTDSPLYSGKYQIRNTLGAIVSDGSLSNNNNTTIDVSRLIPGVYVIHIFNKGHINVGKFIKL